jgi:hypothetical protein
MKNRAIQGKNDSEKEKMDGKTAGGLSSMAAAKV